MPSSDGASASNSVSSLPDASVSRLASATEDTTSAAAVVVADAAIQRDRARLELVSVLGEGWDMGGSLASVERRMRVCASTPEGQRASRRRTQATSSARTTTRTAT